MAKGGRRPLVALSRRWGEPGLYVAKATAAAALAFLVAEWIGTSASPVLAPLTALLVVQVTAYETLTQSVQRVASVVAGVFVAIGVAAVVGLSWWSLAAVVAVSLVLGGVLRLGPQLLEVPISAMLILAVGGNQIAADARVFETLVGAGVGVVLNVAIVPPLYLRPADEAVGELANRIAAFLRSLASALRPEWSRAQADHWLDGARALGDEVGKADRALARAEKSARLNPRSGEIRRQQPRLRTTLTGLDRCYLSLRELCRALLDRTYFVPHEEEATAYGEDVRAALCDVLLSAADAVEAVGEISDSRLAGDRSRIEQHLAELHRRRDLLSELLLVDPLADQAAWQQHGALLTAVDRLRVEVEAAARQPDQIWRPSTLTDRQRDAVRRVLDSRWRGWRRRRRGAG